MNYVKGALRKKAVKDGFYDGRFAPKVVPDARHVRNKYLCREVVEIPDDNEDDSPKTPYPNHNLEEGLMEVGGSSVLMDVKYYPFRDLLKKGPGHD